MEKNEKQFTQLVTVHGIKPENEDVSGSEVLTYSQCGKSYMVIFMNQKQNINLSTIPWNVHRVELCKIKWKVSELKKLHYTE